MWPNNTDPAHSLTLVYVQSVFTFTPLFRPRRPQLSAEEISLLVFLVGVQDGHVLHTPTKHINAGNVLHISVRHSVPENPQTPKMMTSTPLLACYRGHQACKISSIFIWTVSGPSATRVDTDKGCWNTEHKFCENICLQLKLNSFWCH